MADKTGIEWADATWNPWMGCKKVSPGCKNCYMFRERNRFRHNPTVVVRAADSTFQNPLTWMKRAKLRAGARIFACSWSDWFIEEADEWRPAAWRIIKATPQYTYLILTKRPERLKACLPERFDKEFPNVWLLVSAENQETLHERWDYMRDIKSVVRGISAEPLLSQISLGSTIRPDWVITGGESDRKNPRIARIAWFQFLRNQCVKNGIPFFHKQHGGRYKINGVWGGRELDGIEWNQFPSPSN